MSVRARNNVTEHGIEAGEPILFAHGLGCDLAAELTNSICRADPAIARRFARLTFTSDNRADLARVSTPSLVLQCSEDVIAPEPAVRFVAERLDESELVVLDAVGHCPNLSAPAETAAAIEGYLRE